MSEIPEYEKYPVSEEEMGKRYKNWTETLASQMALLFRVGKETGGNKFVEKLKEELYNQGKEDAVILKKLAIGKEQKFADCGWFGKQADLIDDMFANFWHGYIEHTPEAFEKEIYTCPVARLWSNTPELCDIISWRLWGMTEILNPKIKVKGFSKLLTRGDHVCRYRIELEK